MSKKIFEAFSEFGMGYFQRRQPDFNRDSHNLYKKVGHKKIYSKNGALIKSGFESQRYSRLKTMPQKILLGAIEKTTVVQKRIAKSE